MWFYNTLQMLPGGWIFGAKTATYGTPYTSSTKGQRSEPKWLTKHFITLNFCAKFQSNQLATTFGHWNAFSDKDI